MSNNTFLSQVAKSTPFDNTTTGASGLIGSDTQSVIEELNQRTNGASGGVTPFIAFSKTGNVSANSYLFHGSSVPSNTTGQLLPGNNKAWKITVAVSANTTGSTTIQFQRRTAVGTFVDIAGLSITITAGAYEFTSALSPEISVGPDWELSCYTKAGGAKIKDPVVMLFVHPA